MLPGCSLLLFTSLLYFTLGEIYVNHSPSFFSFFLILIQQHILHFQELFLVFHLFLFHSILFWFNDYITFLNFRVIL